MALIALDDWVVCGFGFLGFTDLMWRKMAAVSFPCGAPSLPRPSGKRVNPPAPDRPRKLAQVKQAFENPARLMYAGARVTTAER